MDPVTVLVVVACVMAAATCVLQVMAWLRPAPDTAEAALRTLETRLDRLVEIAERTERALRDEHQAMRSEADTQGRALRTEVGDGITRFGTSVQASIADGRNSVDRRLEEFSRTQTDFGNGLREEVRRTINAFGEALKADVKALAEANGINQEALRQTVTERLDRLRADNENKLEAMRATVEEKLQGTLDKRLGDSFSLVSSRLEEVHKGLGEMKSLANGVGDLTRLMSNVKDRGGWAEVQLGAMLEQILTREQFHTNAKMEPNATELVEYAVRMPGQGEGVEVLLPIDAKFPKEAYERLMDSWEKGDADAARAASDQLAAVIEGEARRIASKYIRPPRTTDFAVMYLPTEGLFAEAMRMPGLAQRLQHKYRVTVAGPTTLSALLNSLQMGFRTLAIQKRSSEVWRVLGEAKGEFQKYGDVWDKLGRQLETAQKTIEEAGKRTRAVERKLRDVEVTSLPGDAQPQLGLLSLVDEEQPRLPAA